VRAQPAPDPGLVSAAARAQSRVCVPRTALPSVGQSMPRARGARSAGAAACTLVGKPAQLRAWAAAAACIDMAQHVRRRGHARAQIIRVIRHFLREKRWWHLPRYTFGSSSGGVIALELPLRFPFQARPYPNPLTYPTAGRCARAGRRRRRAARGQAACARLAAP